MLFSELNGSEPLFRDIYFKNMIPRFVNASLELEGEKGKYSSAKDSLNTFFNTNALEYALDESLDGELDNQMIIKINNMVTGEAYEGFRRGPAQVNGSKVPRSAANMIYAHMSELLYNYRKDLEIDMDPFYREAKFHIRFLHIHPFGDGNGRTARVILIKNLCYQGIVPCIITSEYKEEYCSYIENSDIDGLAKMFKERSDEEKKFMVGLYARLNEMGSIEGSKMTREQADCYMKEYNGLVSDELIRSDSQKYPLRNLENLISLFKYQLLPKSIKYELDCSPIHSQTLHIYDRFVDNDSGDEVIYCEETKSMSVKLSGDDRFFKIAQVNNGFVYSIDNISVAQSVFRKALASVKIISDETVKKILLSKRN